MRYVVAIALLVVSFAGQPTRASKSEEFEWNWRDSQTAETTLSESKKISAHDRALLISALTTRFKDDSSPKSRAAETRVSMIDLNGDRVPEVIAQPIGDVCSPTGNCPFWVFKKTATGYSLILARSAIQTFTIQRARTNGYSDLVLGMHGSATSSDLFLYKFSNGRYRRAGCYEANWSYLDENDEIHDLEEPRISPCTNQ